MTIRSYTSLAICTLVVNWTLTILALFSMFVIHIFKKRRGMEYRVDDALVCAAFVVGLVFVMLSTWAIIDEGQGEHQQNVSESQLTRAAKVIT